MADIYAEIALFGGFWQSAKTPQKNLFSALGDPFEGAHLARFWGGTLGVRSILNYSLRTGGPGLLDILLQIRSGRESCKNHPYGQP